MEDTGDVSEALLRRQLFHKFGDREVDSGEKVVRKSPISAKDDIWLIRSLKETTSQRRYESKTLARIQDFVEKITEHWMKKLEAVRDVFQETIAKIVEQRQKEIYYHTSCLKEELQDTKDILDKTEEFDSKIIDHLKETWLSILYNWKTNMFEVEEKSSKFLKTAVARYLAKLVATRHNPCHTFEVMLTLVLELNHIIIGNVQAIVETEHDLVLLWDTHFKDWCVAYYLRAGLKALETQEEEEESVFEEEELEIEGLAALDSILNLIVSRSRDISHDRLQFSKPSDLATIPHVIYLENYWEVFTEKVKIILEVLESEARKLICIKKFLSSIKTDERFLFGEWAKNAGYGEDGEQRFIRSAQMTIYYIRELRKLMMQTVELWDDLTDRLQGIKYLIELLHYKQKTQIAAIFQEWEINMNIAVDELRQAHSLTVLENMWNIQIDKLFIEYKTMLIQSLQFEKMTLDTYTPMSRMTFELFIAALDVVITEASATSNTERIPEGSISIKEVEERNFALNEIIITCVNNATMGYIESLIYFRNEIQNNIDKLDTTWLTKKKADLDWQFTVKEERMLHRMHRMKTDILDIRAAELKMHEEVLYRHAEAIREKINHLSAFDISEGIQPLIEEFYVVVDEVADISTKVSPGGFPRIIAQLEKAKKKFMDLCWRCDHDNQRAFEHIDSCFEWMEQINIQFLSDIKLFSEGGNFSYDEVNGVLFVIDRIDKEMENEMKNIYRKFSKGATLNDMEIGYKMEKFISYMKKTQSELLHKSKMLLLVHRAKRAIKREIYRGRFLLKNAESTLSFNDIKDASFLSAMLEDTTKVYSFLSIPEEFLDSTECLLLFMLFGNQVTIILNAEYKIFEDTWINSMKMLETEFREELEKFDEASIENKEEMKRRLKTMFGHPKHRELLASLTSEASAFCKSQTDDLKALVLNRRSQLKQFLMMFIDEKKKFLKTLYRKVENVYENEDLERILYRLAHHFLSRSRSKKIIQNMISSHEAKSHPSWTEIQPVDEKGSEESVDQSSCWKPKTDLPTLIKSVSIRLRKIISFRDEMLEDNGAEVEIILEKPQKYSHLAKSLKMSLLKTSMEMCQLGKLALAVYIEEMQTWILSWRIDCNRLTELFSFSPILNIKDKSSPLSKVMHKHVTPSNSPELHASPSRPILSHATPSLITTSYASTSHTSQVRR
ncbi:unnamed protein product [Nezara viridula]|uniref:Uncharacterized protein n=1 Tax=Nezara viridula TaxID=85310 RepID=A0A9P0E9C5_NEZVI|nr:unnamed protein product [Nezara viridula]